MRNGVKSRDTDTDTDEVWGSDTFSMGSRMEPSGELDVLPGWVHEGVPVLGLLRRENKTYKFGRDNWCTRGSGVPLRS